MNSLTIPTTKTQASTCKHDPELDQLLTDSNWTLTQTDYSPCLGSINFSPILYATDMGKKGGRSTKPHYIAKHMGYENKLKPL